MLGVVTVSVRPAKLADAAALTTLNRDDLGYDHPLESTTAALEQVLESRRDLVLVAESDGAVVGYLHAEEFRLLYEPPMVNVLGIAVSAGARRLGAGSALMTSLEAWAHERGADALRLLSGESRTEAHAFYRSLGFDSTRKQLNFRKPLATHLPRV